MDSLHSSWISHSRRVQEWQDSNAVALNRPAFALSPAVPPCSSVSSVVQGVDFRSIRKLAEYPMAKVTQVPVATHQVNATCDHPHRYNSAPNPQIMPAMAPF